MDRRDVDQARARRALPGARARAILDAAAYLAAPATSSAASPDREPEVEADVAFADLEAEEDDE